MKKTKTIDSYVFDTSALITLWNDEEGADMVEDLLRADCRIFVSFMSCMEGRYRIWKSAGKAESEEFSKYLDLLPLRRIDFTDMIFEKAIEIKDQNQKTYGWDLYSEDWARLIRKVADISLEMGSGPSGIHIPKGIGWLHQQVEK